jgi:hypothetical protein
MKNKKNMEFSKKLLIQESILVWIVTIAFIALTFFCVINQYFGELPWVTAMCGFPWTAYGASQTFYLKKSERENTRGGIKYETVMADISSKQLDENAVG